MTAHDSPRYVTRGLSAETDKSVYPKPSPASLGQAHENPRYVILSRKAYLRIPGGEIQWGRVSKRLTVWFRGRVREVRLRRD